MIPGKRKDACGNISEYFDHSQKFNMNITNEIHFSFPFLHVLAVMGDFFFAQDIYKSNFQAELLLKFKITSNYPSQFISQTCSKGSPNFLFKLARIVE